MKIWQIFFICLGVTSLILAGVLQFGEDFPYYVGMSTLGITLLLLLFVGIRGLIVNWNKDFEEVIK